jgi:hypothetical protein
VPVGVPTGGNNLVIGGTSTVAINQPGSPVITVGDSAITANPSGAFVVAPGVTLSPGGPPVTVGGSTLSLAAGGGIVVVNGVTQTLGGTGATGLPVLTVNGQQITATMAGGTAEFILGPGTTLTPGGQIVVSGTTFSLPSNSGGSIIVVNGQTSTLGIGSPIITPAPALTINGQTFSATISGGQTSYVLGPGITLTPGGVVTISGTKISLDKSGTAIVIGSSTSLIPTTPASASASTTATTTTSSSSSSSSSRSSSSTTTGTGDAIASGVNATKKAGAGRAGLDTPSLLYFGFGVLAVLEYIF